MERKKSLVLEIKELEPQEEQNAFEYFVNFSQLTFHCENKLNVLHLNTVHKKIVESSRGGKMRSVVLEKKWCEYTKHETYTKMFALFTFQVPLEGTERKT